LIRPFSRPFRELEANDHMIRCQTAVQARKAGLNLFTESLKQKLLQIVLQFIFKSSFLFYIFIRSVR